MANLTASLGLTKPDIGNTDTWGADLNDNFDKIDDAISGIVVPPPSSGITPDSVQAFDVSELIGFAGATHAFVKATAGSSGISLTLPTAVGAAGRKVRVVMIDAGGGGVQVNTTLGQTINGESGYWLTNQWQFVEVQSDDENWIVTASN